MQFPITIGLHRSRFLDVMLLLVALLATLAIFLFPSSPTIRFGLLLGVSLLTIVAWRALTPAIQAIRLERDGRILITRSGDRDFVPAMPVPGATIHPWLIVIQCVTEDGRKATLIATVNRKNRANLKFLRTFMRWQAKFSEAGDGV